MKFAFNKTEDDGATRFEITGFPSEPYVSGNLLVWTACIKDQNGAALLASSGEIIPKILDDGTFERADEYSFFGFESLPSNLLPSKDVIAEVVIHRFEAKNIHVGELTFGDSANIHKQIPVANLGGPVNILGLKSNYSTDGERSKKIDFIRSEIIFTNPTNEISYVTYYIGRKEGSLVGHLGRIGLEQLLPYDTKAIWFALYHKEVSEALGFKISKGTDLGRVKLYPFVCVFSNCKTETFSIKLGQGGDD
jgi:hypothetical protein